MAIITKAWRRRIGAALAALAVAAVGYVTRALTSGGGGGIVVLNVGAGQTTNLYQQPAVERQVRTLGRVANVTPTTSTSVNWYIAEPDCGSITPDGRYTAPAVERTCHIVVAAQGHASATGVLVVAVRTRQ